MTVTAPLGRVLALPGGVLGTLRLLQAIASNTASMAEATRSLPAIEQALASLAEDMRVVAERTEVLPAMGERIAAIEGAMPVLAEQLDELDESLRSLREAVGPLERLARRFPGGSRG